MIPAYQGERSLPGHSLLSGRQRGPVPGLPSLGPDHAHCAGRHLFGCPSHGVPMVSDHHDDPLEPGGEQASHRPFHQAQAAQPKEELRAPLRDRPEPIRAAGREDHADSGAPDGFASGRGDGIVGPRFDAVVRQAAPFSVHPR